MLRLRDFIEYFLNSWDRKESNARPVYELATQYWSRIENLETT